VFDSNTGKFKRGWGGYGILLSEIPNTKMARNIVGTGRDREPFGAERSQFTGPSNASGSRTMDLFTLAIGMLDEFRYLRKRGDS